MAATTDYRDISEIRTRCIIAGIAHQPIASVFPVMGPRRTVTLDHAGRITAGELTLQASAPHKTSVCIENAVQRWMRDYTIRINRGSTQLKDSGAGGRARPLAYVVAQGASALTLGVGMTGRPFFALTHSATRLSTALAEGWKDAHRGVSSYYFASVGGQSTVVNSLSTGARSSRNSTDYVLRYRITLMGEHGELFTLERKSGPRRAPYQASKKCRVTVAPKRELKAETTQKRGAPASKPIGQISSKAASTVPLRGGRRYCGLGAIPAESAHRQTRSSLGTCFVLGTLAGTTIASTAYHVVADLIKKPTRFRTVFRHFRGDTRKLPFVVLAHDKTIDIAIVGVEGTKDEFALIGYLDRTEHRTVAVPHVGGIWGRTFRDGYTDTDTTAYYPSNHFDQPWYGARDLSLRYSVDAGVLMMHSPKDPIQRHRPGRHADSVGDWTTYIFSAETEPGHSGKPVFVTRNNPELPPQQHRYSLAGVLVAEDQSIGHTPGGLSIERERVTLTRGAYVQRLVDKAVTELTAQGRKTLTSR